MSDSNKTPKELEELMNEMGEEFDGDDFVEVIDLDGVDYEKLGELKYEGITYHALTKYIEDEVLDLHEEAPYIVEFTILKEIEEDGEPYLVTIDDEDLHDKIGKKFEEMFDSED
ncbi:MAG: DUF1292 domain-containing protein [Oscillospiraceae bacterium]|nr:DUF1292 domain-containing protein [Oscillospiraceae bacterium]